MGEREVLQWSHACVCAQREHAEDAAAGEGDAQEEKHPNCTSSEASMAPTIYAVPLCALSAWTQSSLCRSTGRPSY